MVPAAAARIRPEERSEVMRYLRSSDLLDTRFRIIAGDGCILIPLRSMPEKLPANITAERADVSFFSGRYSGNPLQLAAMEADIDENLKQFLPVKWEMIGRSLLFKLDARLLDHAEEIGRAYAAVLHAISVYVVEGRIEGRYRKPAVRLVYGKGGETVHSENGVSFVLDVSRVMFSSANHDERMRMSTVDCSGEVVVDMFAGIGHLSMPMAVHGSPRKIIAAEADRETHGYLQRTIAANNVSPVYTALNIENAELDVNDCDRIIMGYLDGTRMSLSKALSMSRRGTIIHFHEEVRRGMQEQWMKLILEKYCSGRVKTLSVRRVKGYSALSDHMAMDLEVLR